MLLTDLEKKLEESLKNKQAVYAVVAIVGSTEHGACDDVEGVLALRNKVESQTIPKIVTYA